MVMRVEKGWGVTTEESYAGAWALAHAVRTYLVVEVDFAEPPADGLEVDPAHGGKRGKLDAANGGASTCHLYTLGSGMWETGGTKVRAVGSQVRGTTFSRKSEGTRPPHWSLTENIL